MLVALHERTKSCEVTQAVSRERIQYGMKTGIKIEARKVASKLQRSNLCYEARNPGVWGLCHNMGLSCDCIS